MHTSRSTPSLPITREMLQLGQQYGGRNTEYRLQTSAYVNREETLPTFHTKSDFGKFRFLFDFSQQRDMLSPGNGSFHLKPRRGSMFNLKNETISKFHQQLPRFTIEDIPGNAQYITSTPSPHNISANNLSNSLKQSHNNQSVLSPTTTIPAVLASTQKSRLQTAKLGITPAAFPLNYKNKRRRFSLEDDPNRLAMKISLPCTGSCCYCVYTTILGPVKVYFTRADKPKKEPLLLGIKDGNGKPVIPVSRRSDVRGLIYDPVSYSLHPPVRSQRPVFQRHCQPKNLKQQTESNKDIKTRK